MGRRPLLKHLRSEKCESLSAPPTLTSSAHHLPFLSYTWLWFSLEKYDWISSNLILSRCSYPLWHNFGLQILCCLNENFVFGRSCVQFVHLSHHAALSLDRFLSIILLHRTSLLVDFDVYFCFSSYGTCVRACVWGGSYVLYCFFSNRGHCLWQLACKYLELFWIVHLSPVLANVLV